MEHEASADEYGGGVEGRENAAVRRRFCSGGKERHAAVETDCSKINRSDATSGIEGGSGGEGGGNEEDGNRDEDESARLESVLDGTPPQQEEQQQQKKTELEDEKTRALRVGSKNPQVVALTRKLDQAKKLNAELHQFYKNEAFSRLENRVKEKQLRIDELVQENRLLKNTERLLAKEIEECQNAKDNFPQKQRALLDELRVCKEKIKTFKEQQRTTDEKSSKMHQKTIALAAKNKELAEKVRQLEGTTGLPNALTPSSPVGSIGEGGASSQEVEAIIASQEEAITRLHQRVALMKKAHKADQAKCERLLKASQDEIEQTRDELAAFHQQLFAQERAARNHFLLMKKLKRGVHELAKAQQSSQHFQQFLVGREVRFASKSGSPRRNHSDAQHPHSQHQLQEVGPTLNPGRRIHDTLRYLGFVMPLPSEPRDSPSPKATIMTEEPIDLPANCVQGKLVPCPPSSIVDKGLHTSARAQFYSIQGASRSSSSRSQEYEVSKETGTHDRDQGSGCEGDNSDGDLQSTEMGDPPEDREASCDGRNEICLERSAAETPAIESTR
ncbi:hypothetical protein BBJ28_00000680 [Nothophytophthora sp. Chile5]|nr:hypothetical protein BBJ28_00000680 [Nothophytophthora sp. Chile5]